MTAPPLPVEDLHALLAVTRALAAPFEQNDMLAAVTAAACRVLRAERASVWLLEDDGRHLRLEVTSDLGALRLPVGQGLVGACAAERRLINVPDCYADPRFSRALDRASGFVTRCLLAMPLEDPAGRLFGVLQVLNRQGGVFGADDEPLAQALAAQCAVALTRVRMQAAERAGERLRHEVQMASELQRSTLPATLPELPGYALHGAFRPASLTGGDTWDLARTGDELLVLLADAAGHGLPAALSVVQMHAMLRMALELTPDLAGAWQRVNDRLAGATADGSFITAFVGLLDPRTHRLRYVSGGQGPILHWRAREAAFDIHRATIFPLGAMALEQPPPTAALVLAPGDWLVLLSDGFHEFHNPAGLAFGRRAVEQVVARGAAAGATPRQLCDALFEAVQQHAAGAPQEDDMTAVLVQRLP